MAKIDEDPDIIPDTEESQEESGHPEPLAPMTFNMPRAWHTRFKIRAIKHGISMKAQLIESFDALEEQDKK